MQQKAKIVRWGIVSTGRITHQFASDFKFVPNGELLAVASRSQEFGVPARMRAASIRKYKILTDRFIVPPIPGKHQKLNKS